jgi:hypothetical protein
MSYTGGGQKKVAPHKKWYIPFFATINKESLDKSYVFKLTCLILCMCE